ncbi:M12 family metallo-peptidase [uncultured Parabacteroides sp.]|uniref:M12 family metallo-peptidase n=1 Tax=uncultured Parabacteroides sp. TaxID=512312 RepID=UPI0026221648|nr:M12 family metallo-peptidase [uncultured Parabacteroides sp.]
MKYLISIVALFCINTFTFSQIRIDIGEVYGAALEKTVNTTIQKIYRINVQTLLDARGLENNQMEVKMSFFNKDYDVVLMENTILENTPAFYTDENGILHEDHPTVKLYAGYLKSDSTKSVRLSIVDNRYINGYINTGEDLLHLSSPVENGGNTIAYFRNDIIDTSGSYSCGTPELEQEMSESAIMPMATDLYDFETVIRIMKIAADADEEFYNLYGDNSNNRILAILNEAEGLYARTFNIAFQIAYVHYYRSNSPYTITSFTDQGAAFLSQVKNYWNQNLSSIDRDVVMIFSGKEAKISTDQLLLGRANAVGDIRNKATSYMATFEHLIESRRFSTVDHELGHLCGGSHSDCQYADNSNLASVMCSGFVKDPPYFSQASVARIGQHIYSNNYLQKVSVTSGSSFVNNSTNVTFTASPFPSGMFTWSGYPMDLVSTSGASATFKTGRDGTSYATIKTAGGASMSGSVYVGKPVITIEGPNRTPNTDYAKYRAIYDGRCSPTKFEWILNPQGNNSVYGANTSTFDIAFYQTGSYQIVVRAANKFGMGEYTVSGVTVYDSNNRSVAVAYPNPASQTLYVDFSSIGEQPAQAFSSTAVQQKHYDVRLFNLQGALVRTAQSAGERISLDVSGLPGGNYFLHIYDGKGEKPVVQQVIVSH